MRWLAIDYGKRRIGLAISDPGERIASPAGTLRAAGSPVTDASNLAAWARQNDVHGIVVGLPLNMDGSIGPQARVSQELAAALRHAAALPVELWDERLTSFQADQTMRAAGLTRAKRKQRRDALAAQAVLQSFLDERRARAESSRPPDTGEPSPDSPPPRPT